MKTSGKRTSELSDNIKEEISVPEGLSSKWATFSEAARLTEKAEYSFRVSAVNEIGRGEPSRATQFVKIGEQPNQPKIDLSCVKDIRVVAGEDFSVNINYTAWPKPTAQFWNEDTELGSDSRVHIQVTDEFVSIIVKALTSFN